LDFRFWILDYRKGKLEFFYYAFSFNPKSKI
jgi:hypothetical protein